MNKLKFMMQRTKRGYADTDVYSIDYWFLETIVPMLRQLKEIKHGHPVNMTSEEWDKILDDMIFYFTEANNDTCSRRKESDEYFERYFNYELPDYLKHDEYVWTKDGLANIENEWKKFEKEEPERYKEYKQLQKDWLKKNKEVSRYIEKCKNEAFKLFNKYFWDLWD